MINIAIDGPSGAGKSTIAKKIAEKLGITYLDTGAMYRTVALYAVNSGKNPSSQEEVVPLLENIKISYEKVGGENRIFLNGKDVSEDIRMHNISKCASEVSKIPEVRAFLVEKQREIAKNNDVVLDGRDITSHVLPDTKYKFYLTATAEERANRRFKELSDKGQNVSYETILADIKDRDYNDMNRKVSPLVKTPDSIEIDSTNMTLDEVADAIMGHIKAIKEQCNTLTVYKNASVQDLRKEAKEFNIDANKVIKKKTKKKGGFYRFLAAIVRKAMGIIWPTKIYFKDNFPKNTKAIVVCNHYTALDPCVIISKLLGKDGKVLMKDEIMKNPFVAKVAVELGCIPVKRGEADLSAVKSILGALAKNQPVLIFPEGTRNKSGSKEMLPLKQGVATFALKAKAPIVPLLYYKKTGPFKRNILIVGAPFYLDEYYDQKPNAVKEEVTEVIRDKMCQLRAELDILVEKCGGSKKKYFKYVKEHGKEIYSNERNGCKE